VNADVRPICVTGERLSYKRQKQIQRTISGA